MSANPTEYGRVVRWPRRGAKNIGIHHGRHDARARTFAGYVFGDGSIAAGHDTGPANQIVGLAEPFQRSPKTSVSGAGIGNISCVIQIEDHRTLTGMRH